MPIVLNQARKPEPRSRWVLVWGLFLSILPDLDSLSFAMGIAYGSQWGHRGFSHSLLVAAGFAGILACFRFHGWSRVQVWAFIFISMASHGLLDSLTDGGKGVALLWPWRHARYFAPFRPIAVSPIGAHFFSARAFEVLLSELLWIGLPAVVLTIALRQSGRGKNH